MAENKRIEQEKPTALFLSREQYNHLLATLALLEKVDSENRYAKLAGQMKQTLLKFSKKEKRNGDDRAAVILYERETCVLIKLMLLYISTFRSREPHDFFSDIGKNIKE